MSARKKAAAALLKFDTAAMDRVEPYRGNAAVRALSWYGGLGDQPPMLALSGAMLAAGVARSDRRMARAGTRMIAAHLLATAAKNFVKRRIDRSRPRTPSGRKGRKPTAGRSEAKQQTSFPSGHSAGALAVALAFAREYPEHRRPALAAAALIGLAQVPRRAHYPSDVGAGVAIGALAEALANLAFAGAGWSAPLLRSGGVTTRVGPLM